MSEIKKGDLVIHVGGCCGELPSLGQIAEVMWISYRHTKCEFCAYETKGLHAGSRRRAAGVPLPWLRKIDPDQASDHERAFDYLNRRQPEVA